MCGPQLLIHITREAKHQVDNRPLCVAMLRRLVALKAKDNTCVPPLQLCTLHLCVWPLHACSSLFLPCQRSCGHFNVPLPGKYTLQLCRCARKHPRLQVSADKQGLHAG